MIAQLRQHGRSAHAADLRDGRRGQRPHSLRQRIDLAQIIRQDISHPQAVRAAGIIIEVDAAHGPGRLRRRGVAVQSKMEIIVSGVRGADRRADRPFRVVAGDVDAGGAQIRLHPVGDAVHPQALISLRHIGIARLCGGTQK